MQCVSPCKGIPPSSFHLQKTIFFYKLTVSYIDISCKCLPTPTFITNSSLIFFFNLHIHNYLSWRSKRCHTPPPLWIRSAAKKLHVHLKYLTVGPLNKRYIFGIYVHAEKVLKNGSSGLGKVCEDSDFSVCPCSTQCIISKQRNNVIDSITLLIHWDCCLSIGFLTNKF